MMRRTFTKPFLAAVAGLLFAEISVHVFWSRGLSGRFEYGYHPTAGFVERGDGSLDLERAGGRRFHPQHYAQQRPAGVFRVMVVGDSVPRGPSLADAYSSRIAVQLRAVGVNAEGWNLCLPGYGARRSHIVLAQALKYQPSLVIRHLNNSNEYEDEREWRRSQDFQGWHPENLLMKSLLVRRLYEAKTEGMFWSLLPVKIRAQQGVNDAGAEVIAAADDQNIQQWQELVRTKLEEDLDLCKKAGVPVLLITQVRVRRGADGRNVMYDTGLEEIARKVARPGVTVLTMTEVLGGLDYGPLFMDTAHMFAPGHEIMAKAIVGKLAAVGLFPEP